MSKHFCCCIPVRFGVFVLSLLTLITAGLTSGALWWLLHLGPSKGVYYESNVKIAIIVAAVIYLVFALFALAGFIGAIIRSRALVRTFSFFLWVQLVLALGEAIAFAVASFNTNVRNTIVKGCIDQTTELQSASNHAVTTGASGTVYYDNLTPDEIKNSCEAIFKGSRVAFIISFVIFFLITLYCCVIVQRYGNQLSEEQAYKASSHPLHPTAPNAGYASYYPHAPLSQQEQGHYEYPYAKPEHGFGNTAHK